MVPAKELMSVVLAYDEGLLLVETNSRSELEGKCTRMFYMVLVW